MYDAMGRRDEAVQIRIINHMENIRGLTTKTGLVRSLKLYYKRTVAASKTLITLSGCEIRSVVNNPNFLHNNPKNR